MQNSSDPLEIPQIVYNPYNGFIEVNAASQGNGSRAYYFNGSGTNTITFLYTVNLHDETEHLQILPSTNVTNDECFSIYGNILFQDVVTKQTWDKIFNCSFDQSDLYNISINTNVPTIWRVTSSTPDGRYFPGDAVDITLMYDKPVVLFFGDDRSPPQLELFIPHQIKHLLANFTSGNNSKELHFLYILPPPPIETVYEFVFPTITLDYAGTSSLFQHNHGTVIKRSSTHPITVANQFLPTEDRSYLTRHRHVQLVFEYNSILYVKCVNVSGIYTAGDYLVFEMKFKLPVMMFHPPVLRMETGIIDRNAYYISGNKTSYVYFGYKVDLGDSNKKLDYIDTTRVPYNLINYKTASYALDTDIIQGSSGRLLALQLGDYQRYNDIVTYPFEMWGGVYTLSNVSLIPVLTNLPLPGNQGSISSYSTITIDTNPPQIRKTFTTVPDGSYGAGVRIPVFMRYNFEVCLIGDTPKIHFLISNNNRYAMYVDNNCTSEVKYQFVVNKLDSTSLFDYKDRDSLVYPKSIIDWDDNSLIVNPYLPGTIVRKSQDSQVVANMTLGWVSYVESVISATSISGSGSSIVLSGTSHARPKVVSVDVIGDRKIYSMGDILTIRIEFSSQMSFKNNFSYFLMNIDTPAFFVKQESNNVALFHLVIQSTDVIDTLSYIDEFSLRTKDSCSIVDVATSTCASQDVPLPSSVDDQITRNMIQLQQYNIPYVHNMVFLPIDSRNYYSSGDIISVIVSLNIDVIVSGSPYLVFDFHTDADDAHSTSHDIIFHYASHYQNRKNQLHFTYHVTEYDVAGSIKCSTKSTIELNGGYIRKLANFVPITNINLQLNDVCCPSDVCNLQYSIVNTIPYITKVYSSGNGTFSAPDELEIFVDYSIDVNVAGNPILYLNLQDTMKHATFRSMVDSNTLKFTYIIGTDDSTAGLDYQSISALHIDSYLASHGIFADNTEVVIHASLLLPDIGAKGSLGRSNILVIDGSRPGVTNVVVSPYSASAGEYITLGIIYDRDIQVSKSDTSLNNEFFIYFNIIADADASASERKAYYSHQTSKITFFTYFVTKFDRTGTVMISRFQPFVFGTFQVMGKVSGVISSPLIKYSLRDITLGKIDNNVPFVVDVFSSDVTINYPWGVGDVITFRVQMSALVAIISKPTLRLIMDDGRLVHATFTGQLVNDDGPILGTSGCYTDILFEYQIGSGDIASPLEYDGVDALEGDIKRCVANAIPTIDADLKLPFPFTNGSLAYCCPIYIDSTAPYVKYVMPLKKAGTYVYNELIAILVRFSKPIEVHGTPVLELNTGKRHYSYAVYNETFFAKDVLIDFGVTDMIFLYYVGLDDVTTNLIHSNKHAIKLVNNSQILHATTFPSIFANTLLRDPNDFDLLNDRVEQQWLFNFPQRVELIMNDLYHTDPSQLLVRVEHESRDIDVFNKCCQHGTFGKSVEGTRLGNNATVYASDTGIGNDLFFSDVRSKNIALSGVTNQSSTSFDGYARRCNDGITSSIYGDKSACATSDADTNPWWQIHLPLGSTVRSLTVWPRTPQEWVPAICIVTIKAWDKFPIGKYRLKFTNVDPLDSTLTYTSDYIQMGDSASNVQLIVSDIGALSQISIHREVIVGDSFIKGHGWRYLVTFHGIEVAEPHIEVLNSTFIGGYDLIENELVENIQSFQLNVGAQLFKRGVAKSVSKAASAIGGVNGENTWLLPYYLFLFEETGSQPPDSLEESIAQAVWYHKYETIDKLEQIVLNIPYSNIGYVKIQKVGQSQLSFVELEVFATELRSLKWYREGYPIKPSSILSPYQLVDSFAHAFDYTKYTGRWSLQITSSNAHTKKNIRGWEGSVGTISDWVLVVTDLAGIVHVYYQDIRGVVTTKPKYGTLQVAALHTTSNYQDWRQRFEITASGEITTKKGFERALGSCINVDTTGMNGVQSQLDGYRYCSENYGVGPSLGNRKFGDYPDEIYIDNYRLLYYTPNYQYLGTDFFTYKILHGLMNQNEVNEKGDSEVTIHVRNCRDNQKDRISAHSLCVCVPSEQTVISNWSSCSANVYQICTNSSESKSHFVNLCETCSNNYLEANNVTFNEVSFNCLTEISRSVSYLTSNRQCDIEPLYACKDELVTKTGKEQFSHLSLKSYQWKDPFHTARNYQGDIGDVIN